MVRILKGGGLTTKKFTSSVQSRLGGGSGGDARLKIIAKNRSKVADARDKLGVMAKTTDARQKLEKIRNLKQGKLAVKKTSHGSIIITTKTNGTLQLTTAKKTRPPLSKPSGNSSGARSAPARPQVRRDHGSTDDRRQSGGAKKLPVTHNRSSAIARGVAKHRATPVERRGPMRARRDDERLTRTILSDAALLDEELINTHVDPMVLKRTIRQQVGHQTSASHFRRSPNAFDRRPPLFTRQRTPEFDEYERRPVPPSFSTVPPAPRIRYDYDDIRREQEQEDDLFRRRLLIEQQAAAEQLLMSRTMADRVNETGGNYNSPLQGTKVVVSNLQQSVSQEDIIELFGDIGALKRAKVTNPGTAEVVYVNKADAVKAVDVYHNRQLDGKAMKCQIVGAANNYESKLSTSALPRSVGGREPLAPDMTAIHKALFIDRKRAAVPINTARPQFTVTMPKRGSRY